MPKDTKAKKEKAPKAPKEKAPKASKKGGPKRALSAYMFFAAAKRDEVKAAHPDFAFTDIGRELGRLWGEMTDKDKKPYVSQAEADKARYAKEVAAAGKD